MNLWNPSEASALLSSEFCLRLTQALLHFLWQGLAIGLAVWAGDRLLRRAPSPWRYAVSVAALLAMLACVPATYVVLASTPRFEPTTAAAAVSPPADSSAALGSSASALPIVESVPHVRPAEDVSVSFQPGGGNWPSLHTFSAWLAPYATCAYVLGVACMLSRLALALRSGQQLRQSATPLADPTILAMAARQARRIGLKVVPAIAWCQRAAVPLVVGIVRPMILLPTAIGSGLSPDQLEALLAHELAHLKRLDLLVNLGQRLAESLLFFHPAVWYVSRRISIERENCCDDCVLRAGWGRVEYADALVRMAEVCAAVRGLSGLEGAALLAASGGSPSQFKQRVLRLLDAQDHLRVGISRGWLLAAVGAVLLGLSAIPFAANWKGGAAAAQTKSEQPEAAQKNAHDGYLPYVHSSLRFLAARQNDDGSFGSGEFPLDRSPALTAICGLALLRGDVVRATGPTEADGARPANYAAHRDKAIEFLLKQQRDSGLLAGADQPPNTLMYNHAFAMWFLAESIHVSGRTDLKEPLTKAVALAVSAQNKDGGWRYLPKPGDADAHITAVQLLALSAARRANVEVPQDVIDKAVGYLKRCRDEQSGGFAYLPGLKQSSFSRSALVLAAITSVKGTETDWLKPSIDYLVKQAGQPRQFDPELYAGDGRWLALLALRDSKEYGDPWRRLDRQFRAEAFRDRQPEGSWREPKIGPERATAMACLVLLSQAPPATEDQAAAQPSSALPTNLSFRETPWPEVLKWYGKIMNQTVEMKGVPGGNFTYESPRPLNQREIALLINREVVRRGHCLVERNGSLTVETADVIARQYAESMRKDFMYGHELRKGPDPFDAYFEIAECRAIGETRPPAPEGPAIAYVLKARRDFTAGQLTDFLNACFGTVSVPSLRTGQPILADGFAVMHGGKWLGANAPALKVGEQIEVWQNNFQEWNARPPADYRVAIDGQVIGADGKPLPAAHVHTLLLEEGTEFPGWAFGGEAIVDRQGKFQVSLQQATQFVSKVYLWASAPGHAPQRIGPIAVGFGKPAVPLTIELKPGFAGRLRLVLPDGTAMDRGEVEIAAQDELWAAGIPLAKLPIQGEPIRIENCPSGPLLLKVRVPGFDEQEVRDVKLNADEVVEVKVPLARKEALYYRGREALERIERVKPAWSETQNGVEFGVALVGNKTKFVTGERVPLEMFVRNVGKEGLKITLSADFLANVPEVKNAAGEAVQVARILTTGSVPLYRETLQPGEAFGLRHLGVGLGPNPAPGKQNWHPYWAEPKPGKYTLRHSHEMGIDPLDGNQPGQQVRFNSGEVAFEVLDASAGVEANRTLQAAQLERREYVEGTFPNDERLLKVELFAAEQALSKSQASLEYSRKLAAKGLIAEIRLQAAEAAVKQAQLQLDLAQGKLDVLRKFTRPKVLRELERKVVEALDALLDQRVALHVTDKPLVEVLDELEKTHGVPIAIDLKAIHARGLSVQARVTIDVTDTPLREVLKAVLASGGLNFEVTGSGISIPAGAKPAAADGDK